MSNLSPQEIDHLAQLARLNLSQEEKKSFDSQLPKIVSFVEELQGAKTPDITTHGDMKLANLREDVPGSDSLTIDQLKQLAPSWQENQVEVPGVFDNNDV
jgi:aspartyl-tRNA(Asn)/glutamyl-tRNA(Gln) amidotransferase subunit C